MRRNRESRFQASHVFTPSSSCSGSQAVIQIAVQKLLYKLTITSWLLPNNMELIDTRQQVDTNKITLLAYRTCYSKVIMKNMHCLTPEVLVMRTVPQSRALVMTLFMLRRVRNCRRYYYYYYGIWQFFDLLQMSKFMNVKIWRYQFWTVLTGWAHLQSPWSRGLWGEAPQKLKAFLLLDFS